MQGVKGKGLLMVSTLEGDVKSDEAVARAHIGWVLQDSPDAAGVLETILSKAGPPAAFRVTYMLELLKMEVIQNCCVPHLNTYGFMVQEYRELVPKFEQAIGLCLQAWGVHDLDVDLKAGNPDYRME